MYAILSTAPQMQCRKISYGHTQTAGIFFLTFRGGVQCGEGMGERGKWGWGNNWGRRECASPVINASTHRVKWRQMVCLSSVHCLFIHQIVLLLPLLLALAAVGQIHTHTHTYTRTSGNAVKQKFMKGKRDSRKRKYLIGLVFNQNKNVDLLHIELKLMICHKCSFTCNLC